MYKKKHSQPRPAELEERLARMSLPTRPKPDRCEYKDCPRTVGITWCGAAGRLYYQTHASRVRSDYAMDSVVTETPRKSVRASGTNPGLCQASACKTTHIIMWCVKEGHKTTVARGTYGSHIPTVPIGRSTAPSTLGQRDRPPKCQYSDCDNGVGIKWCGLEGHKLYYCQAHYKRATQGLDMTPPVNMRVQAEEPAHCQWVTCDRTYRMQKCHLNGHNMRVYCFAHYQRARKGTHMDAPIIEKSESMVWRIQ